MTTTGQRLVDLSGLPTGTAADHLVDISLGGTTAGQRLVSRSSLPSATAAEHLLDAGGAAGSLYPGLFTNAQTFYSAVVAPGPVDLQPAAFTNANTLYAPTVDAGAVTLAPAVVTNDQSFIAPEVGSAYALTPSSFANAQSFFAATLSSVASLQPPVLESGTAFFSAVVTAGPVDVAPDLLVNTSQVYAPSASARNDVAPTRLDNTQAFFSPALTLAPVEVSPTKFTNTSVFYPAALENSQYLISAVQARLLHDIYLLHGLSSPLTVGPTTLQAGIVEQTVSQDGDTVVISTASRTALNPADPGLMIEELAALHGLTVDLEVNNTTRVAGAIAQAFSQAGNSTTVTRQ
jgi:hypothetical protein